MDWRERLVTRVSTITDIGLRMFWPARSLERMSAKPWCVLIGNITGSNCNRSWRRICKAQNSRWHGEARWRALEDGGWEMGVGSWEIGGGPKRERDNGFIEWFNE